MYQAIVYKGTRTRLHRMAMQLKKRGYRPLGKVQRDIRKHSKWTTVFLTIYTDGDYQLCVDSPADFVIPYLEFNQRQWKAALAAADKIYVPEPRFV